MSVNFIIEDPVQTEIIKSAIQDLMAEIAKEEIEKAKKRIDERVSSSLASLAIDLFDQVDLCRMENKLAIRIEKKSI
jgi:hypothetical protein